MTEIQKTQSSSKNKKNTHKNAKLQKNKAEKEKYFSYYDDIKVGSHKVVDW